MNVIELKGEKDLARFNELAHKVGNVFNTLEWLKMFGENVRFFGFSEGNGRLIGGFALYHELRFGLKFCRTPPFTPYIGPFLKVSATNPVAVLSKWKEAVALMAETVENGSYAVVSTFLNKEVYDAQPFIWRHFKVIPHYTYVLSLENTVEQLWQRMSPERRNDIKKGGKDGLEVRSVEEPSIVKTLVLKTFSRQNKTLPESYLDRVLFEFATPSNSFAFGCWKEDIPLSCAFCIHDGYTAYYLLGGYDHGNKHHGAGPMVLWECIKYAKAIGLKQFDFEGSMVPDIERFFRGFGGDMLTYYRVNKATLPLEIALKFSKRELF